MCFPLFLNCVNYSIAYSKCQHLKQRNFLFAFLFVYFFFFFAFIWFLNVYFLRKQFLHHPLRCFICICYFEYHVTAHNEVSTQQKADKAMLTVSHRFLCTQSHLYYIHHCIVKCTVCPLLFTITKPLHFPQVTLHMSLVLQLV